jgi:hypothetical protein
MVGHTCNTLLGELKQENHEPDQPGLPSKTLSQKGKKVERKLKVRKKWRNGRLKKPHLL